MTTLIKAETATNDSVRIGSEEAEDIRMAYQVAIAMMEGTGNEVWGRFNAMLVANSILIAITAQTLTLPSFRVLSVILALLGLALSVLWYQIINRIIELRAPYSLAAREIEDLYLSKRVQLLGRAEHWRNGEAVKFVRDAGTGEESKLISNELRMSKSARRMRTGTIVNLVIGIFGLIYVTLLVFGLVPSLLGAAASMP